ncbi:MAG: DUF302 domain-containing protein [Motiliproteus sp.]|nr:DUF302 domain-containing protein [Motiliproteus sp.]MCW9050859.1 DUF302 domain-containing protein [Motiliproteus sp.]
MKKFLAIAAMTMLSSSPLMAADGMIDVASNHSVVKTADRLEGILKNKGMTVFNRIKHSEAAAKVGVTLRDTELIIFGNPKVGSPLMKCQQSIAIDLPQKALIWADAEGNAWISYNDPGYLQQRHQVEGCGPVFAKVTKALAGITKAAASK